MKICKFCPKELRSDNKSGSCQRHKRLLVEHPSYMAAYYRKHPEKWEYVKVRAREKFLFLASVKLTLGCADCGYRKSACALDFDHLPGTKKVANLGQMPRYSWEKILAEIDKCEVVCANCHRERTDQRRHADGS